MTKALPAGKLEESWDQVSAAAGVWQERVSVTGEEVDGYYRVRVLDRYENTGVAVYVVYDGAGKIAGLQTTFERMEEAVPPGDAGYTEHDVTVAGQADLPLDGKLTLPDGAEKPPVVILLQGSGSSDMDEAIFSNRPFADLAHGLAGQGVATLRYNKRFYQYPDAAAALGTSLSLDQEYLEDVSAAIKLMKADSRVDPDRIFVLGHSLGGMLTPKIAFDHPELAGIISMAGTLRPLWELSYDQNQESAASLRKTLTGDDLKTMEAQLETVERDIVKLRGDFSDLSDDAVLLGIPVGYWRSCKAYAGDNFIHQINLPILVLQGSADFQVYPDKDFTLWEETLAGRERTVLHLYDGLNHLMMESSGARDVSDYQLPGHVDGQVISDIAAFVDGR